MNPQQKHHYHIASVLIGIVVVVIVSISVAYYKERAAISQIRLQIEKAEATMMELAILTDRNAADSTTEILVQDCSRRTEYEDLLVRLPELQKRDLLLIQTLYESCGLFFADRKLHMISRLSREYESYSQLIDLYKLFKANIDLNEQEKWKELITAEENRSTTLREQAIVQKEIISLLVSGSTQSSAEVVFLAEQGRQLAELLTVYDVQIDTLRNSLN